MRKRKNSFPFKKAVTDLILRLGATTTGRTMYEYQLETCYGLLAISPNEDWVATCFDEPNRVPHDISINRHSGKWNFHPIMPGQSWIDFFEMQLTVLGVENKE